ncbi:protein kinase/lanthionine synthetase C family protein [Chitinophaga niabensis]|uniref:protein kinase/lanthionine synthetase C family protein n=1 Tax=Chitinophaga niabensis TaxID=536979 RepID=UPI0031BA84DD
MNSEIIVETALPIEETEVKGKVEKKGGKRIGYNYIILKSLKEHPKNDVVKCIYIKSFTQFGVCVIKEGTAGELKDNYNRDIRDRLIWQKELHELLQDKVRIPRFVGSFEENGNYYLAIEHIKGRTLGNLYREHGVNLREGLINGNKLGIRFLGYLLQIIDLLDTLHNNQIVHRDVTSANFIITPRQKVAIIDMELSYSIQKQMPSPPFMLGTYGYMSPEQLAVSTPTIKEDVFSVGAIMLQAWTNIAPAKLTQASVEELEDKVAFFIPDREMARIISQCLHPDAEKRPVLKTVHQIVEQYRSDLKRRTNRKVQTPVFLSKEQIRLTIQQTINTLSTSLLTDKEKGWFAENRNAPIKEKNKIAKGWYTNFQHGGAGLLYLLGRAHLAGFDVEITRPSINFALSLIENKCTNNIKNASPGLYLGTDGIAACLSEAIHHGLIDPSDKYRGWINDLLRKKSDSDGILSGIAGQGLANMIAITAGKEEINIRLQEYVSHLLNKQTEQGAWTRDQTTRVTKGFANGISGIIYFLLEYAQHYNDSRSLAAAERGLQWLMNNSFKQKNIIEWHSSKGGKISPWWYDGNPGIALAFIKGYAIVRDQTYKEFATGALNIHPKMLLTGNSSLYNGLSGLGEVYLEAYQLLQDDQWMERAEWIAQLIMRLKKTHARYGSYWLVENEKQPVPGFTQGNGGVLHFLLRYCYPGKFSLPMTPIHSKL